MPLPDIGETVVFNYDAMSLVLNDGDPVTTWPDVSAGVGGNLGGMDSRRPVYVADAINGLPGVRFDGIDGRDTSFTGVTNSTTFYVMAVNPNNIGTTIFITGASGFYPFFAKWSQANRWIFGTSSTQFIEFTEAGLTTQPCLWTMARQATGAFIRANGVQKASGNFTVLQATGFQLGNSNNGATATFTVCEVVQYDGILNSTDIETIEAYLDSKWLNPVPSAPTNPTATAQGQTSILVGWDDVADETGYRVERSADGSTGWADVSGNLAADATSYEDTGLTCATQYFYRVIAFNTNGDSDPSTTVDATTLTCAGPGGRKVLPSAQVRMRPR